MQQTISFMIKQICDDKGIPTTAVIEAIELALAAAYNKDYGQRNQNIKAHFDIETGQNQVFDLKTVVEDSLFEDFIQNTISSVKENANVPSDTDGESDIIERFNPRFNITLSEAQKIEPNIQVGEEIKLPLTIPQEYGRVAIQTAKQVILQKLRETEREVVFNTLSKLEGKVVVGQVQRYDQRNILVEIDKTIAILPQSEQVVREQYKTGSRMKFFVVSVGNNTKGSNVVVSRTHPELLKQICANEVIEIKNGLVEIKSISREPGSRSKIAVFTKSSKIDPVGACIGQDGARINTIISEVGGEKIDIIAYSDNVEEYISNSLLPAKVLSVTVNKIEKRAIVEVDDSQVSLAIGKAGQNVRLAVKLTGYNIDIKTKNTNAQTTNDQLETNNQVETVVPDQEE